ncbi:MAG: RND transporter [Rhodobacteraceae bacterium]|nr:RND transporter [Paracoccaceae bacterium]
MFALIDRFPLGMLVMVCATLGLAPFVPEPHVWEKLKMLAGGELARPVDMFDLVFHGLPWLVLALKLGRLGRAS